MCNNKRTLTASIMTVMFLFAAAPASGRLVVANPADQATVEAAITALMNCHDCFNDSRIRLIIKYVQNTTLHTATVKIWTGAKNSTSKLTFHDNGWDVLIRWNPGLTTNMCAGVPRDANAELLHEIMHAYLEMQNMHIPWADKSVATPDEHKTVDIENIYRRCLGGNVQQRPCRNDKGGAYPVDPTAYPVCPCDSTMRCYGDRQNGNNPDTIAYAGNCHTPLTGTCIVSVREGTFDFNSDSQECGGFGAVLTPPNEGHICKSTETCNNIDNVLGFGPCDPGSTSALNHSTGSCTCPCGQRLCDSDQQCTEVRNDDNNCGGCGVQCPYFGGDPTAVICRNARCVTF